jgi:hypothetical protein
MDEITEITLEQQFERAAMVQRLWKTMFPEIPLAEDRAMTWALAFDDKTIMTGLRRAAGKNRRYQLSAEEAARYASSVMKHEVNGDHIFPAKEAPRSTNPQVIATVTDRKNV